MANTCQVQSATKNVQAWANVETEDGTVFTYYDDFNEVVGRISHMWSSNTFNVRVGLISGFFVDRAVAEGFLLGVLAGYQEQDKVGA